MSTVQFEDGDEAEIWVTFADTAMREFLRRALTPPPASVTESHVAAAVRTADAMLIEFRARSGHKDG